jgi:hypothetical protein
MNDIRMPPIESRLWHPKALIEGYDFDALLARFAVALLRADLKASELRARRPEDVIAFLEGDAKITPEQYVRLAGEIGELYGQESAEIHAYRVRRFGHGRRS